MCSDGRAGGVNGAVVVAVNQLIAIGPGHGGFRPVGYGIAVRELAQVARCRQVVAFVLGVVIKHLGELLAGDAVAGLEGPVSVAGGHAGDSGPVHGIAIPFLGVYVLVGVAQVLIRDVRLALQVVENLHSLGAGHLCVGGEGCSAHALHDALFHHIVHGGMVPGVLLHVCQMVGGAQLAAVAAEGHGDGHLAIGLGKAVGAVLVLGDLNLVAVCVFHNHLVHLKALVRLGGDGHRIPFLRAAGAGGHSAVFRLVHRGGIGEHHRGRVLAHLHGNGFTGKAGARSFDAHLVCPGGQASDRGTRTGGPGTGATQPVLHSGGDAGYLVGTAAHGVR